MADYPNITVDQIHKQNDTYKQDLQIGFSAKEGQPDMYIHWGGGPMAEYYKSGCANDITALLTTYDHPDFIDDDPRKIDSKGLSQNDLRRS